MSNVFIEITNENFIGEMTSKQLLIVGVLLLLSPFISITLITSQYSLLEILGFLLFIFNPPIFCLGILMIIKLIIDKFKKPKRVGYDDMSKKQLIRQIKILEIENGIEK